MLSNTSGNIVTTSNASACVCCSNCSTYCIYVFESHSNCSDPSLISSCDWSNPTLVGARPISAEAFADLMTRADPQTWVTGFSDLESDFIFVDDGSPCGQIWYDFVLSCDGPFNPDFGNDCPSYADSGSPFAPGGPASPPSDAVPGPCYPDAVCADWTDYWSSLFATVHASIAGLLNGTSPPYNAPPFSPCLTLMNGVSNLLTYSATGAPGRGGFNPQPSWYLFTDSTPNLTCNPGDPSPKLFVTLYCAGIDPDTKYPIWQVYLELPCTGITSMTWEKIWPSPIGTGGPAWTVSDISDGCGTGVNTETSGMELSVA